MTIKLRKTLPIVLTGLVFLTSLVMGQLISIPQADAAGYYSAPRQERSPLNVPMQSLESAQPSVPQAKMPQTELPQPEIPETNDAKGIVRSFEESIETVRERLNLDEPLPESTKDFIKQIKGEDVEIEEPRPSGK